MTFNITNVDTSVLKMGGVGIPLPYNDNWVGKDQAGIWIEGVVSDAAVSMDAGYVITNRLSGDAPTSLTTPIERSKSVPAGHSVRNALTPDVAPLEQYRLNYGTRLDYLSWDPLSGDTGVNIALHARSPRAIAVNDATLGGWAGFGAAVIISRQSANIAPTDSSRQRVFIAENALYMELGAGYFTSIAYDTFSKIVTVVFDAGNTFTPNARIRTNTTASTASSGT